MSVVEWFTDPLAYEFMRRAMVVALVCGVVCAVLSCWLTLLGWSLMGDAVSHAVLPGVVLSYVIGAPFAIGAFIFGSAAVFLVGGLNRTSRVKEDAAIGIVFTGLFALGLVLVSAIPSQIDLFHILFGNVLGVSDGDIAQVVIIGTLVTAVLLFKRRDLVLYAFDPTHAHAVGISPKRLEALLLGALALTVIVALQAVGIVLVVAMLITPGATAYLITDRFSRMLAWAAACSVSACLLGTYLSYHLDWSTGGSIVCVLSLQFVVAYLVAPKGVLAQRRRSRPAADTSEVPAGAAA
jgi:manganese transport system permease protein